MRRKPVSGFAEAGAAMAQQLDDNDLLNLFSAIGRVVSKRFLMKRPSLERWQLVIDYLTSAMAFEPREQFRVLYLDKRNNLIADEVMHEGTVDHTPVYPREVLRRAIELHATGCVVLLIGYWDSLLLDDFDDGRDLFGRDPPPFPFRPTRYHLELETLVQPDCPVIVAQSIGKQGQRQLSRAASAIAPAKAGRGMVEQV